VYHLLPPS